MKITQRIPKFSIVIISLIFFWIAYKAGIGIVDGKLKAVYMPIGFSIFIVFPYIVDKTGTFPFLCGLIFIYWLPFNTGLGHVSPFLVNMYAAEFGMWMLCLGALIHGSITKSDQFASAIGRFPFLPFALLIAGSLSANLVSANFFARTELSQIRILFFIPSVTCFVCLYFIKTVGQAERLIWIFLISAGILGLVYLFAPNITGSERLYSIAEDTGRIQRTIKLPLFGVLNINPANGAVCFSFIVVLSFNLWLNHPSLRGRLAASVILAISVLMIIQGQGRTGLISAICGVIAIQVLSLRFKIYASKFILRSLLKPVIVICTTIFTVTYLAVTSPIFNYQQRVMNLYANPLLAADSRINRWETAVRVVLDNLHGVGIFGFPNADGLSWVAHNLYLFLLLSSGIIGFIGYIWIFLRYTKAWWYGLHYRNLNRRLLCIAGIGCVVILIVGGMGSCIYWSPWETLIIWIPIGVTMAAATLPEEDGRQRTEVRDQRTEFRCWRAEDSRKK